MAEIYKHNRESEKAEASYNLAIQHNPNNINAYLGLGTLYSFQGNYDKAEQNLQYASQLNPYHQEVMFNLGFLHYLKKSFDDAATYFKKTIEIDPNHHNATYLLAAVTGDDTPEHSPESFVRGLFDHYAETFDDHLVKSLSYNTPNNMFEIYNEHVKAEQTGNLLDLGCGTGLSSEKSHSIYDHLVGIDLSENMLSKAKEKNIYNELHSVDISAYLNDTTLMFDLVVASDVFVYIGNIENIFKQLHNRQNAQGYFVFSVEKSFNHDSFHLRSTGRYSHNQDYINSILDNAGYNMIQATPKVIRNEKGSNIEGIIYLCQKR